ncbi:MAG TPA: flagellar biosynthesis protein FlhB [Phycisphaerales bacterium]|nr:flagellar biosynthesis protein FlhB [Phycisphaerales bacterium]
MADDLGEKTEAPSGRKLEDARGKGQVAKSQDLAAAIDLIGGVILLMIFGGAIIRAMTAVMRNVLTNPGGNLDPRDMGQLLVTITWETVLAMTPVIGLIAVVAAMSHIVQFGLLFTTQPLMPKFDRLNPITGFGRLLSRRNLAKTGMNVLKLVVVTTVAWLYLKNKLAVVAGLPLLDTFTGVALMVKLVVELAIWLLALLLVIGAADFLYQKWQHTQDLKMTKEEVKDERRNMDGDPQVKGRRMKLMRDMAMQRVAAAVPKADVIVTNPTHYSIAIQYDEKTMRAPRVVAKGVDHMAMRIRQLAMIHKVPIVERPPLARALYAGVEVGQEVSPEFYQAIAELLAYVYRLESKAA